jgi:hypothetical protein
MLLLGVVQAQAFETAAAGSYDLLATEILTGSAASVTFSSLGDYAADYQHLQIRYNARIDPATGNALTFYMQYNGDTGSNYNGHALRGNGSTVTSSSVASAATVDIGTVTGASGNFGAGVIDILDPFDSNKYTTARSLSGSTGGNQIELRSHLWRDTDSLTSITVGGFGSEQFTSLSRFSLYGLKASV